MGTKQKKNFNWGGLIITLIVLALIGFLAYWIFGRQTKIMSIDQFKQRISEESKGTDDKNYLKQAVYDQEVHVIYVIDYENGSDVKFEVGVTQQDGQALFSSTGADHATLVAATHGKQGADVRTLSNPPASIWPSLLFSLLPIVIIIGALIWLAKRSSAGAGSPFGSGKSKAVRIVSDKKFTDIAGNEEVKEEVIELVDYLKNPSRYKAAGAKIPKGILLEGPPGTGKTLLAKATAGEASVPFFFISGSSFVEMFIGLGASRVRDMFRDARKNAPCIIFIDELDAVGRVRGAGLGGGNDEREQTLNQLLVEMDGIEDSSAVLIMAATNRADVLDPALLRPGRFDRCIKVALPDVKEREAILKVHAKGKRIDPVVDFHLVAKRTPGYSGAQLANVINEAILLAVRDKRTVVGIADIDEAIDRAIAGPARKSRTITPEELRMIANHEAGHAVIGIKVPGGQIVQKITIIPRGNAGGYNLMTPEKETFNYKKSELHAKIMSFMGGRAAEQIIYGEGEVSTGASDDIDKATSIARAMVTQWGMSPLGPIQYEKNDGGPFLGRDYTRNRDFSDQVGYEIDREVRKIIDHAEKEAIKILKSNLKLHKVIVDALLENETIVAEEIAYIAKHLKMPVRSKVDNIATGEQKLDELIKQESIITEEIDGMTIAKPVGPKAISKTSSSKGTVTKSKSKSDNKIKDKE